MVSHGGSSAGSYLADPTSPIPSHCAVFILFQKKCPSASIIVTSTFKDETLLLCVLQEFKKNGGNFVAVNDISLDMFEGQITALLGHNGAERPPPCSCLQVNIHSHGSGH